MKKFIIFIGIGLMFLFTSCADEDLAPILVFESLGKGAYPKLIEASETVLDLSNFAGATFTYSVEFISIDNGENVASYDIYVAFDDNTPGNGDGSKSKTLFKSFGPSDFSDSADGNKSISISIPLTELASTLGVPVDQISATDEFNGETELILDDGSKFGSANSTPTVNSAAFAAFFDWDIQLLCLLPDNLFNGSYTMSYEGDASGGFGEPIPTGTYTVTPTGTTTRSINFTTAYNGIGGFALLGGFEFQILCETVVLISSSEIGAGCGAGRIGMSQAPEDVPIDISDDSQFTIVILDLNPDGGCGFPGGIRKVMNFTKN